MKLLIFLLCLLIVISFIPFFLVGLICSVFGPPLLLGYQIGIEYAEIWTGKIKARMKK